MTPERAMYLATGAIDRDVMATMPRETARLLFAFQAADINARWRLIDMAEALYNEGNSVGCAHLINAHVYLSDRAKYQRLMETERHPGDGFAILFGTDGEVNP